jgi:hypothetical protein
MLWDKMEFWHLIVMALVILIPAACYKLYLIIKSNKMKAIIMAMRFLHTVTKKMNTSSGGSKATMSNNRKYITISYTDNNKEKIVIVPYDRSLVSKQIGKQVILEMKNKHLIDITQAPGIPYMLTAGQMDGVKAIIKDIDTGVTVAFGPDERIVFT